MLSMLVSTPTVSNSVAFNSYFTAKGETGLRVPKSKKSSLRSTQDRASPYVTGLKATLLLALWFSSLQPLSVNLWVSWQVDISLDDTPSDGLLMYRDAGKGWNYANTLSWDVGPREPFRWLAGKHFVMSLVVWALRFLARSVAKLTSRIWFGLGDSTCVDYRCFIDIIQNIIGSCLFISH